ncbi:hypothetical protein JB92DRAFT_50409 [Gautieria morchelliformis]|nr:hypothetical protein JB92DRAFT_50409 [Gautieria morchelliformis]
MPCVAPPQMLQIKKELLVHESSFSVPDNSVDSSGYKRLSAPWTSTVPGPHFAATSVASDNTNEKPTPKATGSPPLSGQANVGATKAPAALKRKPAARSPPVAPRGLANTTRLPSFRSVRPKAATWGPNMMTVPSAPRAMASVMPVSRSVFVAPTGAPTTVATISSTPSPSLRPEGPELPPSQPPLPSARKNISIVMPIRKVSIPSSAKQERSPDGGSKQEHVPQRPSSSQRRGRSSSSSVSSSSSRSRSSSQSPLNRGPRGRSRPLHRLPRRRSISPSGSTFRLEPHRSHSGSSSHSSHRSPSSAGSTRYQPRCSISRSSCRSPSQLSPYRRRKNSSPGPALSLCFPDSPAAHASSQRHLSPDSDRQFRGRRKNRRNAAMALARGAPAHDHWSPGGDDDRGHSSRHDTNNALSIDAATLAQPMNPHNAVGRKTGNFRRS